MKAKIGVIHKSPNAPGENLYSLSLEGRGSGRGKENKESVDG
jgi:hypothetical protein